GSAIDQHVNEPHPDTGAAIVGTDIPDWPRLIDLVQAAALVFPGIRTQSWDVALTDQGPVLLEVNYGGDLNLGQ
ncbi:sugar-transfer associated ATP-grasp domain-containing protein, partial [Vibrio parahaemolyticus]